MRIRDDVTKAEIVPTLSTLRQFTVNVTDTRVDVLDREALAILKEAHRQFGVGTFSPCVDGEMDNESSPSALFVPHDGDTPGPKATVYTLVVHKEGTFRHTRALPI